METLLGIASMFIVGGSVVCVAVVTSALLEWMES
jgi:hypothetical protein